MITEATSASGPLTAPEKRNPWYKSLFLQLLTGIAAGILVGWLWPAFGADMKPFADGFIKLITMMIAPIIFCTVVLGIVNVGDLKSVGRIGGKALLYFEVATTFALVFGLVVGNIVKPGSGFSVDPATLATGAQAIENKTRSGELPHTVEFLMNIIPTSVMSAFAENQLLQVLFFAVLFGLALAKFREKGPSAVVSLIDDLSQILFSIIGWIMRLAPLGAFGSMAFVIGQYGISSLAGYGKLIAACYLAAVLFVIVLSAVVRALAGVSLWKFLRYIRAELFTALGTASSEVIMPRIMVKLMDAGCSRATTSLVVPTGYSFNMDGSTLYMSIGVLFIAQALGVDLSLSEQITALLILMVTSKGMAGVPGSSFLVISATIGVIGHGSIPVAALALLLGADRIMDSMRVSVNVIGNCVATVIVANWEGQLDKSRMRIVINGEEILPFEDAISADDEAESTDSPPTLSII